MIAVIFVRTGARYNGGEINHTTDIRYDPAGGHRDGKSIIHMLKKKEIKFNLPEPICRQEKTLKNARTAKSK